MNITWDLGKDVTYEVLIANLGGYEKAKTEFEARKRSGIHACDLERALLQYRREHNIYEMGDWIIFDGELMVFAMWSDACPAV